MAVLRDSRSAPSTTRKRHAGCYDTTEPNPTSLQSQSQPPRPHLRPRAVPGHRQWPWPWPCRGAPARIRPAVPRGQRRTARRDRRWPDPASGQHQSEVLLRCARFPVVRGDYRPPRVLPHAHRGIDLCQRGARHCGARRQRLRADRPGRRQLRKGRAAVPQPPAVAVRGARYFRGVPARHADRPATAESADSDAGAGRGPLRPARPAQRRPAWPAAVLLPGLQHRQLRPDRGARAAPAPACGGRARRRRADRRGSVQGFCDAGVGL
ncbi:hypothetical protein D3C86_1447930 [compost metagenome]